MIFMKMALLTSFKLCSANFISLFSAMAPTLTTDIANVPKEIAVDLFPFIRIYKDGSLERLLDLPYVPPSPEGDLDTGVFSKDIVISDNPTISARIYLPKLTKPTASTQTHKLPVYVYFHSGGFCVGSSFNCFEHPYLNDLVSKTNIVAVSVDYSLAPEHPLPAAYDDSWAALQWVASHSSAGSGAINSEPWLISHGDFDRVYVGGDSAGGNIAHNLTMRAGVETLSGDVKILGAVLSHPYFWGSKPIGSEPISGHEETLPYRVWTMAYPSAPDELDNPMINPMAHGAASLAGLGCSKLLVCVAGEDQLRGRGVFYSEAVKRSGWQGELQLFEVEGEDHVFHIIHHGSKNSKRMIQCLASFIN